MAGLPSGSREGGQVLRPFAPRRLDSQALARGGPALPSRLTSFVGRERELTEVARLLAEARLVTLVGVGGVGKTRLALEAAERVAGGFSDGVFLVELAPLADPILVPSEVARALGVLEQPGRALADTLAHVLGPRQALLLLDNCEHLTEACAYLSHALLRECPDLRILATSREALGVPGEVVWSVPPLTLPDPHGCASAADLARSEAGRLFLERARSAAPDFVLDERSAAAVAEVCRRLDGLPLAIELAAARVRVLSPEQIANRLDDALRLLTTGHLTAPPRHQTLRALIDWSHDLLSEPERVLFRRLAVFAGGWTLEAAEAVCASDLPSPILDLLSSLIDRSLVVVERQASAFRYHLLETVRQYAAEKLRESGEEAAMRDRHRAWLLGLAEQVGQWGPEPVEWLDRCETELDNLRAVLAWCEAADDGVAAGLRLAAALNRFWDLRGHVSEGRAWLAKLLARSSERTSVRGKALVVAGFLAFRQPDPNAARALLTEALDLARKLDDQPQAAFALVGLGGTATLCGDQEAAEAVLAEAMALSQALGLKTGLSMSLFCRAQLARARGEDRRAELDLEHALTLVREVGDQFGTAYILSSLGQLALLRGAPELAMASYRESLELRRKLRDVHGIAECLEGLAGAAAIQGRTTRAVQLVGAAAALREQFDVALIPLPHSTRERDLAAAREALGPVAFEAAWSTGRAMPPDRVIEYALDPDAPPEAPISRLAATPSAASDPPLLSPREREVAALVGRGLTNRQIADVLMTSRRTAEAHVHNILRKLGLETRAQLAVWAAEQGLMEGRPERAPS